MEELSIKALGKVFYITLPQECATVRTRYFIGLVSFQKADLPNAEAMALEFQFLRVFKSNFFMLEVDDNKPLREIDFPHFFKGIIRRKSSHGSVFA